MENKKYNWSNYFFMIMGLVVFARGIYGIVQQFLPDPDYSCGMDLPGCAIWGFIEAIVGVGLFLIGRVRRKVNS